MRSHQGGHRHHQPWLELVCPSCGQACTARRTLPGRALHVRTHLTSEGQLCDCTTVDELTTP